MAELNFDEKVTIKSIASWNISFNRINTNDGTGAVTLQPYGTARLSRAEVFAQVQSNNPLFVGLDGRGGHATIFIDDTPTRVELGFESEDGKEKQEFLTEDRLKAIFELKTQKTFESRFEEAVKTRAEKSTVMDMIRRMKLNDYAKIRFAERYTGVDY